MIREKYMNNIFEIPARHWAWYVFVSLVTVIAVPIVGDRFYAVMPLYFAITTIFLTLFTLGFFYFGTPKNHRSFAAIFLALCAFATIIVIKFFISPMTFIWDTWKAGGRTYFGINQGDVIVTFFAALGTFLFYRTLCYLIERFVGHAVHGKKQKDADPLMKINTRVVLVLIGIPVIYVSIVAPVVILFPVIFLFLIARQAALFLHPLYGVVVIILLLLFITCYGLVCKGLAGGVDSIEVRQGRIASFSWFSMALLFYIHIIWIIYMSLLGILFRTG